MPSFLFQCPLAIIVALFRCGRLSLVEQCSVHMWAGDGGVAILGNIVADWGWVSLEQERVYETLDYCFYDVDISIL